MAGDAAGALRRARLRAERRADRLGAFEGQRSVLRRPAGEVVVAVGVPGDDGVVVGEVSGEPRRGAPQGRLGGVTERGASRLELDEQREAQADAVPGRSRRRRPAAARAPRRRGVLGAGDAADCRPGLARGAGVARRLHHPHGKPALGKLVSRGQARDPGAVYVHGGDGAAVAGGDHDASAAAQSARKPRSSDGVSPQRAAPCR